MLAFRILTTLLVRNGLLVKGRQFNNDRRIGSVLQTVNVFQNREIDEMIIVDIDASKEGRLIDCKFIDDITANCFMPLGFGGGIKSLDDVKRVLDHGADKVIIGTNFNEKFVEQTAKSLGGQSITVSIDYSNDDYFLCSGTVHSGSGVFDYAKRIENAGAGEIILNNIDRDGTLEGLIISSEIIDNISIPIIVAGGSKDVDDFITAYECGCAGVSTGALYQFTEMTPKKIKKELKAKGIPVR